MAKPDHFSFIGGRTGNYSNQPQSVTHESGRVMNAAPSKLPPPEDPRHFDMVNGSVTPDGNFNVTRGKNDDSAPASKANVMDKNPLGGSLESDGDLDVTR